MRSDREARRGGLVGPVKWPRGHGWCRTHTRQSSLYNSQCVLFICTYTVLVEYPCSPHTSLVIVIVST
jgi:hypothetical protein